MKKLFKIKRQDSPEGQNYWEEFEMVLPVGATLIQVLEQIRLRPITVNQQAVNPVAWDSCCHQAICG
ncbi:MAG TPA: succinate dehydrogenase iron-sulfur subunit, partial [Deltaproteobacteria bacterium]|nr:succinate dehydrogenase iron-sulfur subunit [Deltaproteobacteria bacterium]